MTNHLFARFTRSALAAAALSVFSAAPVLADNINVGDTIVLTATGTSISGAVFNFDLPGGQPDLVSFCLQRTEFIDVGESYVVGAISTGSDDEAGAPGGPAPDVITNETAWIYSQYRAGALGAFSINDIQAAIWSLEETLGAFSFNGNDFPALDPSLFPGMADLLQDASDAVAGGFVNNNLVQVLNLRYLDGRKAQDQLAMVTQTVPEPGSMMLLGAGLLVVARASRRRRQLKA